ncbi:MAG TPA: Gfo/Idh/MocA family oxidoreductase [Acidobacteriota bacterium]|jgi:predicted dehydrogenase|nr:Gfo/Idh/MocA family oxidoreductase [Acidobacteriota bacterium]
MKKNDMNRRQFLQSAALAGASLGIASGKEFLAASANTPSVSPNDRITVGMIGVGARAQQLLNEIQKIPSAEIVAVCDAYKGRVERAVERTGGRAKVSKRPEEIVADRGIDVIVIATPDHLHRSQAIAAIKAGKDVYIEKPLTYRVDDGNEIAAALKGSGRIFQVGSQGISSAIQQKAREIIKSGALGQITMVRASYNRNTPGGAWIYPIPPDASPETVDWEMFLGPAPKRPFSPERFFRWRCFWDYSGGIATDLFVHLMTTIHYIMDAKMANKGAAMAALYRWKETRDVPDTINAVLEYPEGFMVNLSGTFNNQMKEQGGFQILGTEGSLVIGGKTLTLIPENVVDDNNWIVESWPRRLEEQYYKDPKIKNVELPNTWDPKVQKGSEVWEEQGKDATLLHLENFFNSVRTRQEPVETALVGHRAAAVAHMVNESAKHNKTVLWDYKRETFKA